MQIYRSFNDAYIELIHDVYRLYDHISHPRGMEVREILAQGFIVSNPRNRLPFIKERKFNVAYYVAETLFYLLGKNDLEWIAEYSAFWNNVSDDGTTVNSAYGHRIFKNEFNGRSQWDYVIEELTRDPDSRRAVVHIRLPGDSKHESRDVPCTISLSYMIRNNELHAFTNMRSTDLIFGLGNDFPAFSTFQELLALQLNVGLGNHYFMTNSLHVYSRHYEMCKLICEKNWPEACTAAMKPMLTQPNLSLLESLEQRVRTVDVSDRSAVLELFEMCKEAGQYWGDWMFILLARRLKKAPDDLSVVCHGNIHCDALRGLLA